MKREDGNLAPKILVLLLRRNSWSKRIKSAKFDPLGSPKVSKYPEDSWPKGYVRVGREMDNVTTIRSHTGSEGS